MKFMDIKLFDKRYVYLEWSYELEGKDCVLAKSYQDLKDFVNSGDKSRFYKASKGKEKPFTNLWSECDFCYYDPNLAVKKAWLEGKTVQYYSSFGKWEDLILAENCNIKEYLASDWDKYEWRIKPTETWYIIFAENHFLRISDIVNSSNVKFFSGTYVECGRWIDNHKSYEKICKAKLEGKSIEYRAKSSPSNAKWHIATCSLKNYDFDYYDYRVREETTRRMTNRELAEYLCKGNGEMKMDYFSLNLSKFISTVYTSYTYVEGTENEEVRTSVYIRDFGSDEWREPLIEV